MQPSPAPITSSGALARYVLTIALVIGVTAIEAQTVVPQSGNYLDMHVHVAGIGAGDSGVFISDRMRNNFRFDYYLKAMGVSLAELEEHGDQLVVERISATIADSHQVDGAVILALDGVIDRQSGELDRTRTMVYVPNEFVATQTARHSNLHFGASINPYRPDALERLTQAKANGALLVKWIPATMHIDPADESLRPFYRKLVELNLPLLSHAGKEKAFPDAAHDYGDPQRLELPLSMGVTVIAAHVATTGRYKGQPSFERLLPMFELHPNLYAEVSSLTQINKLGYLNKLKNRPDVQARLLYGTDWPLIEITTLVNAAHHTHKIGVRRAHAIRNIDNPWDADVALKRSLGVPEAVFQRSAGLLLSDTSGR